MLGQKADGNKNVFNVIDELLALWKAFWYFCIEKKYIPCFGGLVAKLLGGTDVQCIYLTYPSPISKPITYCNTIIKVF